MCHFRWISGESAGRPEGFLDTKPRKVCIGNSAGACSGLSFTVKHTVFAQKGVPEVTPQRRAEETALHRNLPESHEET